MKNFPWWSWLFVAILACPGTGRDFGDCWINSRAVDGHTRENTSLRHCVSPSSTGLTLTCSDTNHTFARSATATAAHRSSTRSLGITQTLRGGAAVTEWSKQNISDSASNPRHRTFSKFVSHFLPTQESRRPASRSHLLFFTSAFPFAGQAVDDPSLPVARELASVAFSGDEAPLSAEQITLQPRSVTIPLRYKRLISTSGTGLVPRGSASCPGGWRRWRADAVQLSRKPLAAARSSGLSALRGAGAAS